MGEQHHLIQAFLSSHSLQRKKGNDLLIELVHAVASIPWGEGRTVEEVLKMKKVGTCTGKHLVLSACLEALQIPWRPVVCTFQWGQQNLKLPDHLQEILKEGEWEHGHNFVQVQSQRTHEWIDLDVTWDPPLKPYGFLSLPETWDATESFIGLKSVVRRFDGASILEKKEELIAGLNPDMRERRAKFLKGFIEWISSLRKS